MQRFATGAVDLMNGLFPRYAAHLERARTSYRPVEIAGRKAAPIVDDTRLHVDAFPTRPMKKRPPHPASLLEHQPRRRTARLARGRTVRGHGAKTILPGIEEPNVLADF